MQKYEAGRKGYAERQRNAKNMSRILRCLSVSTAYSISGG